MPDDPLRPAFVWYDEEDEGLSAVDDFRRVWGYEWPNCDTPDCENKRCCWGGTGRCHPCSVRLVGRAEMDRRYIATRSSPTDDSWNGEVFRA